MGQMLIRNLDDAVIDAFKRRGREHATSAEEEVRRTLTVSATRDPARLKAEAKALRDRTGPLPGPTSTELLRADRDRDNLS